MPTVPSSEIASSDEPSSSTFIPPSSFPAIASAHSSAPSTPTDSPLASSATLPSDDDAGPDAKRQKQANSGEEKKKKKRNNSENNQRRRVEYKAGRRMKKHLEGAIRVPAATPVVDLPVSEGARQGSRSLEVVVLAVRKARNPDAIRTLLGHITPVPQPRAE